MNSICDRRAKLFAVCAALCYLHAADAGYPTTVHAVERYTLSCVADTSGPIREIVNPVISNTGVIAFLAALDNGQLAILAVIDGTVTTVADASDFPEFNSPSISKNGTIVFAAREAGSGPGLAILAWRNGVLTKVVDKTDGPFIDLNTLPALSERNVVAFWGRLADGSDVIATRSVDGGPINVIASAARGVVPNSQAPDINARGTVVFTGAPLPQGGDAVIVADARGVTVLVDSSGPFHVFSNAATINDSGTIAFHANLDSGSKGVFKISSRAEIRPVALDGDVLRDPHRPAINSRGEVAFMATIVGGTGGEVGIFTGPNAETDKVVTRGDTIDDFTIGALEFFKGLNDKGEIVFSAASTDGRRCLGLASPRG